jgi:APA family basic amino acid/polyamine antiporter
MSAQRQLGWVSATAIVVASMIGTGVFTTSGFLLRDLGSPWFVLEAWFVGGILAILGALSYSALARRIPESGGEYVFLSRTVHPSAGYLAGWVSLLAGFSAPLAAAAFAFGEYAKPWLPFPSPQHSGTLLILFFAMVHALHVQRGAWLQNLAVIAKVALILGFIVLAMPRLHPTDLPATNFNPSDFCVSLVWISFCYSGWNAAIYIAGEVRKPERNLPLAMVGGTILVMLLYLGLNTVFVFSAPPIKLAGQVQVGRIAAEAIGGPGWAHAVIGLVALTLISTTSSMIMAGPRVYARMAEDGYLPRWFIQKQGPPRASIMLQAAIALLMLWTATFDSLLTYIGFTLGLSTAATVLGLFRLRLREGTQFRVWGWPWVPALFLLAVLAITLFSISRNPIESACGLITITLGYPVWWWQERLKTKRTART